MVQVFIKGVLPNSRSLVYQLDLNMLVSDFQKFLLEKYKLKKKYYYLTIGTKCIYDDTETFLDFNKKNELNKIKWDSHIWVKIRS